MCGHLPAHGSCDISKGMANKRSKGPGLLAAKITDAKTTKTDFARGLGMTLEQLRHIETGRRRPTLEQGEAIRRRLKIPVRAWL